MTRRENVSIHTPTRGVTVCVSHRCQWLNISIHTPTRGVTKFCTGSGSFPKFQSTLPQGEWQNLSNLLLFEPQFQSTLPQGEWLLKKVWQSTISYFNPHSHKGSDDHKIRHWTLHGYFNPHSHKGSDPASTCSHAVQSHFNPHSHKGSDNFAKAIGKILNISIHTPTRGVTLRQILSYECKYISIHTPTRGVTSMLPRLVTR